MVDDLMGKKNIKWISQNGIHGGQKLAAVKCSWWWWKPNGESVVGVVLLLEKERENEEVMSGGGKIS